MREEQNELDNCRFLVRNFLKEVQPAHVLTLNKVGDPFSKLLVIELENSTEGQSSKYCTFLKPHEYSEYISYFYASIVDKIRIQFI